MFAFISGSLVYKDPSTVVIDNQGIGYQLRISLGTYRALGALNSACRLHAWLHIKEDAHTLYGFADADEKNVFLNLISVSGVGPGTALLALSYLSAADIVNAIVTEDVKTIQGIKGVGAKTAQRLILELKDKLKKDSQVPDVSQISKPSNNNRSEALIALVTLGIARPAAEKALDSAIGKYGVNLSVEDLVKQALKTA